MFMSTRGRQLMPNRPRKAFVAGATSPTGRLVVEHLLESGIDTWAHIRPDQVELESWRSWFEDLGARVDVTPWEQHDISGTISRLAPTHVFSLLGSSRLRTRKRGREKPNPYVDSYMAVDYGLTAMLIRACVANESHPRFVMVSAVGARENSRSQFMQAKAKAEKLLDDSGVEYTVIRSPIIRTTVSTRMDENTVVPISVDLRDAALELLGDLGMKKLRKRHHSITAEELAEVVARAGFNPASDNLTFDPEDYR